MRRIAAFLAVQTVLPLVLGAASSGGALDSVVESMFEPDHGAPTSIQPELHRVLTTSSNDEASPHRQVLEDNLDSGIAH